MTDNWTGDFESSGDISAKTSRDMPDRANTEMPTLIMHREGDVVQTAGMYRTKCDPAPQHFDRLDKYPNCLCKKHHPWTRQ